MKHPLGDIAEIRMGYPFRSRLEHDPRSDLAVIQMKDIDDTNLLHADGVIRVELPDLHPRHLLRAGDLVFRSRGRNNGAARVHQGIGMAVLAAPLLLIRPHAVLPEYLCWYINTPATQAELANRSEGTLVPMISAATLRALEVPVPPIAAQQHIAAVAALADKENALSSRIAALRQRLTAHQLLKLAHEITP